MNNTENISKSKVKAKKILVTVLIIIIASAAVIGAICIAVGWYMSAEQQIIRALENEDYEEALDIYTYDYNGENSERLVKTLEKRISNIKEEFSDGTLEYEVANMELTTLEKMGLSEINAAINETKQFVFKVNRSRIEFNTAETMFEGGNYKDAIGHYRNVIEEDINYESAKERLAEAVSEYRGAVLESAASAADAAEFDKAIAELNAALEIVTNDSEMLEMVNIYASMRVQKIKEDALAEAAVFASAENYDSAIKELENALSLIETDVDISNQLKAYETARVEKLKSDALAEASEYAAKEDFASAIKKINAALKEDKEDTQLTQALTDYTDKYVSAVCAKADKLVAEDNYSSALSELNAALKVVAGNETLVNKRTYINKITPVSLSTLRVINGGWTWNEGSPVDPFGNDYSKASNYYIYYCDDGAYGKIYEGNTYAEYRLYGEYAKITGKIGPHTSMYERGEGYIQIYADGALVYTSIDIGRKTDAFDFSVDLSGVDYIKIVLYAKGDYWDRPYNRGLILSDVKLYPNR